ncbi:MAG: CobW family GTP-binding protein [Ruthenibacterium sp.]
MELYCITGFLGAGKTTFLKNFIRLFEHRKIFLLINEFGKVGVDASLLRAMHATLAEINNGSIFCACRLDQFEAALEDAVRQKPDVILVEASGLSDPTNIRKVLSQPMYRSIDYKGCICLVDAVRFEKVVRTARVCPKQIAVSSLALLNKTDLASLVNLENIAQLIREINPAIAIQKTIYGAFDAAWLPLIVPQVAVEESDFGADITLQKASISIAQTMSIAQLHSLLAMLAEDTYRMKGFVRLEQQNYLVDCVGPMIQILPYEKEPNDALGTIVLLAGQGMPLRKSIQKATAWYSEYITEGKNDR